ncbi:hypothetical protein [Yoonia sp.]|uniref:hypothetical protein n=1 Tax=Yoonia sp. TaxID=2212373 RepID=UPI002E0445B9|nr:hypothetical protein [Yoonia sp.]
MTTLTLSWPSRDLSQNSRVHWAAKARATASHKTEAWTLAKAAKVATDPHAVLTFTFHPPNNRHDVQNLPGMCKAAIDGIAQAMGCDDKLFRCRFPDRFAEVRKLGQIIIEISAITYENKE